MILTILLPVAACVVYFIGDKLWLGDALRDAEPRPATFRMRLGVLLQSAAYVLLLATLIFLIR